MLALLQSGINVLFNSCCVVIKYPISPLAQDGDEEIAKTIKLMMMKGA